MCYGFACNCVFLLCEVLCNDLFYLRIINRFHFTRNEDMTDYNLILWMSRGQRERKHGGDQERERIRKMGRRADENHKWEEMRIKTEGEAEEKQNIVTESGNSRWLNAADGRPARECISILLYKTVHAGQKQKKKWDTHQKGRDGLVSLSVSPPVPFCFTVND